MTDVFISYKKEDLARVEPIACALAQAGYDVWWDHRIPPGRTYRDVIGAALESAKCVIVVWSSLSANAQWVLDEADEGKKRNVLLPLLIDNVDIPYGFRQIEAARLTDWHNDPSHPEWKSVLESVAHFVGRAAGGAPQPFSAPKMNAPPPPAAPAREPAPKKSGGAGLLIGLALVAAILIGEFAAWQLGVFGGAPQVATTETPVEEAVPAQLPVNEVRIESPDSTGFKRQNDGAWIEMGTSGLPRFRFAHERYDGEAAIVFDETRNVRLRFDFEAGQITEETPTEWRPRFTITESVRGHIATMPQDMSAATVTRVWFEGGGAFVMDGANGWAELAMSDGMAGSGRWREESRDADTIILRDDGRQAGARIELTEGWIYLYFPDWGDWRQQWRIRAVDRE